MFVFHQGITRNEAELDDSDLTGSLGAPDKGRNQILSRHPYYELWSTNGATGQ